jgi:hypothetical protein
MPTALTKAAEEALATFRHHDALAIANRQKANAALERFLDIVSYGTISATPSPNVPTCVRVWTRWLADNGPANRQDITKATGTKFTERGTPHTLRWEDIADGGPSDIPENTIIRFRGLKTDHGRGAPPTIYALWSQRFDVLPKFGVGPERPFATGGPVSPGALTGVLQPGERIIPMIEVTDSNGWAQQAWALTAEDLTGDGVVATVSDPDETDLTMDDLYNAWENAEPVDLGDGTVDPDGADG